MIADRPTSRRGRGAGGPDRFEALHRADPDPWRLRSRWYEARKRAVLLASLPERRYACGYEPGCSNGELSAALAGRCDRVLAADVSPTAVRLARARTAPLRNVEVACQRLPDDWPEGSFDLIVLAEIAYFLEPPDLDRLADLAATRLAGRGTIVACHWVAPIEGFAFPTGADAHARLVARLVDRHGLAPLVEHRERAFALACLGHDTGPVAPADASR